MGVAIIESGRQDEPACLIQASLANSTPEPASTAAGCESFTVRGRYQLQIRPLPGSSQGDCCERVQGVVQVQGFHQSPVSFERVQ